jgi:predicted MFS family arabinose efflux permease
VAFNGAAIIGPALGGVLVVLIGFAGNFFINGMSFVAVLIALLLMKIPKYVSPTTHTVLRGIREGLAYIRKENLLVLLLVNYGSLLFFGATYTILLSLFAVVVLSANPVALGLLYTAIGLGTIIGSLGLASLGDFKRKGALLMSSSILFSLSVIVFSFSRVLWLSFILLLVVAGTQAISGALTVTSLQLKTPRHMLGLVMSLNTLIIMGIRPMGAFPFGALANVIGVAASIAVGAIISGMVSTYIFSSNKGLRNL